MTVDEATVLVNVVRLNKTIIYQYVMTLDDLELADNLRTDQFYRDFFIGAQQAIVAEQCRRSDVLQGFKDMGFGLMFSYYLDDGTKVGSATCGE